MRNSERRTWAVVFLACALPRVVIAAVAGTPFESDHIRIAESIAAGGPWFADPAFPTFTEPGYAMFLAAFTVLGAGDGGRLLAQIALTSFGGLALFILTKRLTGDSRAALIASGWYAVYPYFVWQSATYSGAAFGAACLSIALLALDRIRDRSTAVQSGLAFGVLVLTRFSLAPLAAAAALLLARRSAGHVMVFVACVLALTIPWMLWTFRVDGGALPSRSGLVLFLSTCEYRTLIPAYDTDVLIPPIIEKRTAAVDGVPSRSQARAMDRLLRKEAWQCASAEPLAVILQKARMAMLTFSPLLMPRYPRGPSSTAAWSNGRLELRDPGTRPRTMVIAHIVSTGLLVVCAAAGMARRRVRRQEGLLWTLATFVVVNGVFILSTRLTSPMYVVLMCYAGAAFTRSEPLGRLRDDD